MHPVEIAHLAQLEADYETYLAAHADEIAEQDYQGWAAMRREDGEDPSREAYDDYLEGMLPTD